MPTDLENSNGHKMGKSQFSFQSQRKVMPKNFQTIIQLHSFHMLARKCSKSFKLGFSSSSSKNFQMYKLDLEKAEEPDILECEVKWALESITIHKASGGDGIPVELFQILKDAAVKVVCSIC